jgi:hypothetical protein
MDLRITAKDLVNGVYQGDVSNHGGSIYLEENLGTVIFPKSIRCTGELIAGKGTGIQAGCDIQAGYDIQAGCDIQAGYGILAGLAITAKGTIEASQRILAGTCSWKEPTKEEMTITCSKLVAGKIVGNLVETGLVKEETCSGKVVEIDGKKYKLVSL